LIPLLLIKKKLIYKKKPKFLQAFTSLIVAFEFGGWSVTVVLGTNQLLGWLLRLHSQSFS
jgi:hypothetical protein